MSTIQELFAAVSDTWKALGVIAAALAIGGLSGVYIVSYRDLPEAVDNLSVTVSQLKNEVAVLNRSSAEAEKERRQLRCLVLANYRGGGVDECLENY